MKKNILAVCLIVVLLVVSFAAGFSVTKSQAVVPLGFGGLLVTSIPCTCSVGLWEFYKPFWAPAPVPSGGALSYLPWATVTFPWYVVVPIAWHLGLYSPAAESCWIGVIPFCVPLPVLGHEIMVGTSGQLKVVPPSPAQAGMPGEIPMPAGATPVVA